MRTMILLLSVYIAGIAIVTTACKNSSAGNPPVSEKKNDSSEIVKRGEYLVTIGVCDDCHSPKTMGAKGPEIDMERRLSGFPGTRPAPSYNKELMQSGIVQFNEDFTSAAGVWGISFAANLTSDASGIGNWPLDNFKYAIRHGKLKGMETGRDLLPPMPWTNFSKMTDEDIEAVYTYLKTIKPVNNVVPAPIPPAGGK